MRAEFGGDGPSGRRGARRPVRAFPVRTSRAWRLKGAFFPTAAKKRPATNLHELRGWGRGCGYQIRGHVSPALRSPHLTVPPLLPSLCAYPSSRLYLRGSGYRRSCLSTPTLSQLPLPLENPAGACNGVPRRGERAPESHKLRAAKFGAGSPRNAAPATDGGPDRPARTLAGKPRSPAAAGPPRAVPVREGGERRQVGLDKPPLREQGRPCRLELRGEQPGWRAGGRAGGQLQPRLAGAGAFCGAKKRLSACSEARSPQELHSPPLH